MLEHTAEPQSTASSAATPPPPVVRRRVASAAIGLLLVLWAIVTLGARPLTPWIQGIAEGVEVALGLDLMLGPREKEDEDEAGGRDPEPEKK